MRGPKPGRMASVYASEAPLPSVNDAPLCTLSSLKVRNAAKPGRSWWSVGKRSHAIGVVEESCGGGGCRFAPRVPMRSVTPPWLSEAQSSSRKSLRGERVWPASGAGSKLRVRSWCSPAPNGDTLSNTPTVGAQGLLSPDPVTVCAMPAGRVTPCGPAETQRWKWWRVVERGGVVREVREVEW